MPVVDIMIGKRTFQLACDEGQEGHLQSLASGVSERMEEISELASGSSETVLLVMTALMMEDELKEGKSKAANNDSSDDSGIGADSGDSDEAVGEAINAISEYIENIAERLETR